MAILGQRMPSKPQNYSFAVVRIRLLPYHAHNLGRQMSGLILLLKSHDSIQHRVECIQVTRGPRCSYDTADFDRAEGCPASSQSQHSYA